MICALPGMRSAVGGPWEVHYHCSADGTDQPAMFYAPDIERPVPLLVALHTWRGDYTQDIYRPCFEWYKTQKWAYIHPDFRGSNNKPEATGSDLVVTDIEDAVEFAKREASIDSDKIYLVGTSGGGHAALLMTGRAPELWAGVSAWCGISDLAAWYRQHGGTGIYARMLEKSCGGPPGSSEKTNQEYRRRSPLTYLKHAAEVPLDINAGIYDGHRGSVPVSQYLRAFNAVAEPADRISEKNIRHITEKAEIPSKLQFGGTAPHYGEKEVLFRKRSGSARVTVFRGEHEIIFEAALHWLHELEQGENPEGDK